MDGAGSEAGRALADVIREVLPEHETAFAVVAELDKDGKPAGRRLVIEQRRLQPEAPKHPARAESPARAHEFADVEGFAAYLATYGSEHLLVLADPEMGRFAAVLDETAPKGFEVVTCRPAIHPVVKSLIDLRSRVAPGGPLGQVTLENLVRWVVANRAKIDDGRDLALQLSQVTARSEVTLQRGRGNRAINGLVVQTTISGEKTSVSVDIPDEITLRTPLFLGPAWPETELAISVLLAVAGNEIVAQVDILDYAEKAQAAFLESVQGLARRLGAKAVVGLGSVETAEWRYLRNTDNNTGIASERLARALDPNRPQVFTR